AAVAVAEARRDAEAQKESRGEAERVALAEKERVRQLELRVSSTAGRIGRIGSAVIFVVGSLLVGAGVVIGLPGLFPSTSTMRPAAWLVAVAFAILNALNLIYGIYLQQLRSSLSDRIGRLVYRWIAG
ncbi:MAG: hypothetical protein ACREUU_15375, partial [Gammaproteobacteria bacterium]